MTKSEAIKELNTFRIGAKSELGKTALDMAIKVLESKTNEMTNGDIIKAMFPNAHKSNYVESYMDFTDYVDVYFGDYFIKVPLDWWNAPYQSEVKE